MSLVDIDIRDVAFINGLQTEKQYGPEIYCVCPHCGKPNLSYTRQKGNVTNKWKCLSCDEGGGSIKLHIWCQTTDDEWNTLMADEEAFIKRKKQAFKEIMEKIKSPELIKVKESRPEKPVPKQANPADEKRKSNVFYAFLEELKGLKCRHYNDLFRRGMTTSQIYVLGYKSLPEKKVKIKGRWRIVPDKEEIRAICRRLIQRGFDLSGVPGFYRDEEGEWVFAGGVGYVCPVYDTSKATRTVRPLILGFQIRRDNPPGEIPKDWMKYIWFSSSGKEEGASSGAPSIFLKGKGDMVIITEGILKSAVTYELLGGNCSLLGVPGINSTGGLTRYFPYMKGKIVYEAFDMDKADPKNPKKSEIISKAAKKLQALCKEQGIVLHPLEWDVDKNGWKGRFKGIDDMLCFGNNAERFGSWIRQRSEALKRQKNSYL